MPGERSLELITVAALPDNSLSQGRYVQTLDLNIVSDDDMVLGSRQLTLGIDIIAAALIGLKGQVGRSRGAASVDLGELEKGSKDLPITLYVLSTGGYRVSVSSENQGRLKHENALWYVDYRLRLGRSIWTSLHPTALKSCRTARVSTIIRYGSILATRLESGPANIWIR